MTECGNIFYTDVFAGVTVNVFCDGIDRIFLRKRGKITVGIKTIVAPDAEHPGQKFSDFRLQDHLIPILHILHFADTVVK